MHKSIYDKGYIDGYKKGFETAFDFVTRYIEDMKIAMQHNKPIKPL